MLPPNSIIPFDGNHADIPTGFTRDTRFDGKFIKGTSSGWGTTGGNATHTHTVTHTHTIASHTHTGTTHDARDIAAQNGAGNSGGNATMHSHGITTNSTGSEATGSTAASLTATSSLPPYYTVIFIKATNYNLIPENGMIFRTSTRTGLTYHSNSENKFLLGSDTGANAGSTGGSTSHSHTQSHTHTANAHSHTATTTRTDYGNCEGGVTSAKPAGEWHSHTFGVTSDAQAMNSDTTSSSTSTVQPYHKTILHFKATARTLVKEGDIVLTTEATNPIGWNTCDGTNSTPNMVGFFVKNTQTNGTIDGSNTHSHSLTHSHTGSSTHTHTWDQYSSYSGTQDGSWGSGKTWIGNHRHERNIAPSAVTANYSSNTTTSTETNNEPPYIQVKFIQYKYSPFGGANLIALGVR